MACKRRRERDRPKAAPDLPYNPNKRVLLSYASDDDTEDDLKEVLESVPPLDPEAIKDDEDPILGEPVEVTDAIDVVDHLIGQKKRSSESSDRRKLSKSSGSGRHHANVSLAFEDDVEQVDEDNNDTGKEARAYLRSVRSERQGIPVVLLAPSSVQDADKCECGDTRGYLSDGAYVARPIHDPMASALDANHVEPRVAADELKKSRFWRQRRSLRQRDGRPYSTPPDSDPLTTVQPGNQATNDAWAQHLLKAEPNIHNARCISADDAIAVLQLIQERFLVRNRPLRRGFHAWIWVLLLRCEDVGTMNNDQVYILRDFAKQAVLVQLSFRDPSAAAQLDTTGETESAIFTNAQASEKKDDGDGSSEPAHYVDEVGPSINNRHIAWTLNTIDTILFVVGDIYGQRDLLEFRRGWNN